MEFFLHNEEGIQFPPIRPSYQTGDRYFNRFCCLIPRDSHSSILGEGGAGVVHLARDETMDRLVALKLLSQELQSDPMARLDVIRETRQAMDLTHPNIVRIHDFHEGREGWGISMQYIKGLDLDKWRIQNSSGTSSIIPYPVERIEDWVRQLCAALSYAHDDALMVHRDIKPRNLMLERREGGHEKLYLTDFGITKKLATHTLMVSKVQPAAKDEKAALGTLPYMSWQQLEDETPTIYDDIYSVGATIYDLITGRPPFFEGSYDQIRHQIEKTPPPSMAERLEAFALPNPGIPSVWEDVVRDCLMKDPQDRPTSLREISERLGLSSAAPVIVQSAAAPAGNPVREAELEEALSAKNGEIANLTQENQTLLQRAESLSAEKTKAVESLEAELLKLRESISSGDNASESLKAELIALQSTIGQREEEVSLLHGQIKEVQKTAQLDGDQATTALKKTIEEKDTEINSLQAAKSEQQAQLEQAILVGEKESAQVAELSKTIGERESEVARLREQLTKTQESAKLEGDEATSALQNSITEKDAEISKLHSEKNEQQSQLEQAVLVGEKESAQVAELSKTIGERENEVAQLRDQLTKTQEAAKLEGDEAITALQNSIAEKDAEISSLHNAKNEQQSQLAQAVRIGEEEGARVAELSKTIGEREGEVAQLRDQLSKTQESAKRESEKALSELQKSLSQKDTELTKLRANSGNQQAKLDEALLNSQGEQERIANLEKTLKSTQSEQAKAAKQIEQANSQATAATAEKENAVAKSKQKADQALAKLNELKERQSAPLTPLLITLLGSLILGVGGGVLLGKFMPAKDESAPAAMSLEFDSYDSQIPTTADEPSALISAGLFRDFALTTGVSEDDLDKLAPGLSEMEDEEPVAGLTYLMAESFCAWLTVRDPMEVIDDGSRAHYRIPARNELPSEAGQSSPEWTSTPFAAAGANDARQIAVADDAESKWLVKTWTATLKDRKPMTFRVILSTGPK